MAKAHLPAQRALMDICVVDTRRLVALLDQLEPDHGAEQTSCRVCVDPICYQRRGDHQGHLADNGRSRFRSVLGSVSQRTSGWR